MSIFHLTFTDGDRNSADLTLQTFYASTMSSGPAFIDGISGTFNGIAVTGLGKSTSNIITPDNSSHFDTSGLSFTLANGDTIDLLSLLGQQGAFVQGTDGSQSFSGFSALSLSLETRQVSLDLTDSGGHSGAITLTLSGNAVVDISGTYDGSAITGLNNEVLSIWLAPYQNFSSASNMEVSFNLANGGDVILLNSQVFYNGVSYSVASDTETVLCFCAGTRIATPAGDTAVETLKMGDLVLTAAGEARPVRWLGRSDVSALFADPLRSAPIRITAGALGMNLPARDLCVSPAHAIFLNEVLVEAAALVNGTTILREPITADFSYYHVELDNHELLISEGLATESFVDNVDRMHFSNWATRRTPETPITEMAYPRAKSARQLPMTIRKQLSPLLDAA